MFLCTWVALHLDVPKKPRGPFWKRMLERIGWVTFALVAPEAVLAWASTQWTESCGQLVKLLKKYPNCSWTETHAMFAHMGGFRMASESGLDEPPLKQREFFCQALRVGGVELPKIKEDEISDKSKGDSTAKAVAIVQTLWFGVQVAHRASSGLVITELEFTTLGHVILNILVYWFWWNKPLNVQFPIDVHPRKKNEGVQAPLLRGSINNGGREAESQMQPGFKLPFRVRIATSFNFHEFSGFLGGALIFFYSIMTGLFGAIHCLAWNSPFPTHTERIIWRVCALIITAAPVLGVLIGTTVYILEGSTISSGTANRMRGLGVISLAPPYALARICLLVVSLTSLRALPYRAYENPSWSLYIPHIS